MWAWLMNGVASSVLGVFGSSIIQPFLNAWAKKQDVNLETLKAKLGIEHDEAIALIAYETQRVQAQVADRKEMMQHRVWWVAWVLFVFPVAIYNAMIYAVSILHSPIVIDRVPATQEGWAQLIVLSMFGLYATNTIVGTVIDKIKNRN